MAFGPDGGFPSAFPLIRDNVARSGVEVHNLRFPGGEPGFSCKRVYEKRGSTGILPVGGELRRIPFHKESMGETPMLRHSESFSNTL
jgi:hypothetical protein